MERSIFTWNTFSNGQATLPCDSPSCLLSTLINVWAIGASCSRAVPVDVDVDLPADCALARREHPRLLFTETDLPRLRARLKHPQIAAELEHARRLATENEAGAILLGVLYYLTEERKYIEEAELKLKPSWVQTYPLAADLVMGAITPAKFEGDNLAVLAAARFHDGLGQWWTEEVISTISIG